MVFTVIKKQFHERPLWVGSGPLEKSYIETVSIVIGRPMTWQITLLFNITKFMRIPYQTILYPISRATFRITVCKALSASARWKVGTPGMVPVVTARSFSAMAGALAYIDEG